MVPPRAPSFRAAAGPPLLASRRAMPGSGDDRLPSQNVLGFGP
jgi:hypothetical protein